MANHLRDKIDEITINYHNGNIAADDAIDAISELVSDEPERCLQCGSTNVIVGGGDSGDCEILMFCSMECNCKYNGQSCEGCTDCDDDD
jgi:hypothetical protein